jgi:hypothetical protein
VLPLYDVRGLPHPRGLAGRDPLARDLDLHRVAQVAPGDRHDPRRHGGGEERRLPRRGGRFEDRLEILGEAHVQHLVGLVEHHQADPLQIERPAPEVVERAPRRGDHHVHAPPQSAELLLECLPAVDRQHPDAERLPVAVHRLGHLHGQLAGRYQDERAHTGSLSSQSLQQRQREGGRLAGAGRGLAQEVAAVEQRRDRLLLDRSRFLVAQRIERAQQRLIEAQGGKGVGGGHGRGSVQVAPTSVSVTRPRSSPAAASRRRTGSSTGSRLSRKVE